MNVQDTSHETSLSFVDGLITFAVLGVCLTILLPSLIRNSSILLAWLIGCC